MRFQGCKQSKRRNISTIAILGATHVGKVRSGNEDVYRVQMDKDAPDGINATMIVADGMGGHAAGEVASKMAADGMLSLVNDHPPKPDTHVGEYHHFLGQILSDVNLDIFRSGQSPIYQGMGTTCTAAVLKDNQLHVAHVGDSRGYILRAGELVQITRDHSWVGEQVEAGRLTLEEAMHHPRRNIVTRAIGIEEKVKVDNFVETIVPRDIILLCSDGLNSVVDDDGIASTLKTGDVEAKCNRLIELANNNGGPDNITVVVAEIVA